MTINYSKSSIHSSGFCCQRDAGNANPKGASCFGCCCNAGNAILLLPRLTMHSQWYRGEPARQTDGRFIHSSKMWKTPACRMCKTEPTNCHAPMLLPFISTFRMLADRFRWRNERKSYEILKRSTSSLVTLLSGVHTNISVTSRNPRELRIPTLPPDSYFSCPLLSED